jgi:hypothetical protein
MRSLRPAEFLGESSLEFVDLRAVAVEEAEVRRLRAGRAAQAAQAQRAARELDRLERDGEVLRPERGALADGRRLRGLEVRESERRERAELRRERSETVDRARELPCGERQALRGGGACRRCRRRPGWSRRNG